MTYTNITYRKEEINLTPRAYIHVENAVAFIAIVIFYMHLDYSLLLFFLLLFSPDLTMIGYAWNQKIGSIVYNLGHNLVMPIVLISAALVQDMSALIMLALIWFAHIFLDRALGFGLKYRQGFKVTHLQKLD